MYANYVWIIKINETRVRERTKQKNNRKSKIPVFA